ncbi:MAG: 50S ribosomal protein L18 [Spirochaetota bacterium]
MINKQKKQIISNRRKERVRYKLKKQTGRPRLVFNRSNRYLTAQVIDDSKGETIAFAVSSEKDFPKVEGSLKNLNAAKEIGKMIAARSIDKGIKKVMLDRGSALYHGKVAAFAESAREAGLEF